MNRPVLLLTGFEPFGGDGFNPSGAIAGEFDGEPLPGKGIVRGLILPVSGPAAWSRLARAVREVQPRWIVATGVSGRQEISIETMAWNEVDYRIPDNAGLQPRHGRILMRGPSALTSALAERMLRPGDSGSSWSPDRIPVCPGTDPGRFVCNHVYYRLLHLTRRSAHPACQRAVFLHLPPTHEMKRNANDARVLFPLASVRDRVTDLLGRIAQC